MKSLSYLFSQFFYFYRNVKIMKCFILPLILVVFLFSCGKKEIFKPRNFSKVEIEILFLFFFRVFLNPYFTMILVRPMTVDHVLQEWRCVQTDIQKTRIHLQGDHNIRSYYYTFVGILERQPLCYPRFA